MIIPIVLIGGVIGAIVFWKDICKPIGDMVQQDLCSGGSPIDQIAKATQDAIKQFEGTGNPGQGLLNSSTHAPVTLSAKDLATVSKGHPKGTGLPGTVNAPITPAELLALQTGPAITQHDINVFTGAAKFARANLGEISLYRMSIG